VSETGTYQARFKKHQCCVLLPTYNNAATLEQVIQDVARYTDDIIVVNDGSTDDTKNILKKFSSLQVVSYEKNVGKGWALRKGFEYAFSKGYRYAITIDSDGQHFADELPKFIERLAVSPDAIIIGARNMEQKSVPGKSSFGNKFSTFWFKVETGIDVPDTQSGYRLYPLHLLKDMRFFTVKYEFEIEVLVRGAWNGVKIDSIPVQVYYAPKETRVSHFRPFQDFSRISVLNTFLVLFAFLYIKPRDYFKRVFREKNFIDKLNALLFDKNETNLNKSLSVALGFFMGIAPLWGFQMAVGVFLAFLFRLNKAIVLITSNISIPPMIPLILFLSYKFGEIWVGDNAASISFSKDITLDVIHQNMLQYIFGSITFAVVAALVSGSATWTILYLSGRKSLVKD
jgi:glycosyltransferase involved in cell wall biosynthesis